MVSINQNKQGVFGAICVSAKCCFLYTTVTLQLLLVTLLFCQVVLPMPGNTVKYPENAMGTWYRERLVRDGLEDCRFRVSSLKLNLPGCYRPLLAVPHNLRYQLQRAASREGGRTMAGSESLTLTLNFDLDSSCYATICLREIMKCDP